METDTVQVGATVSCMNFRSTRFESLLDNQLYSLRCFMGFSHTLEAKKYRLLPLPTFKILHTATYFKV
jgi:hypothetical protein